mgnify:CR=1 FL=1
MFTMYWQGWRAETFEASTVCTVTVYGYCSNYFTSEFRAMKYPFHCFIDQTHMSYLCALVSTMDGICINP